MRLEPTFPFFAINIWFGFAVDVKAAICDSTVFGFPFVKITDQNTRATYRTIGNFWRELVPFVGIKIYHLSLPTDCVTGWWWDEIKPDSATNF